MMNNKIIYIYLILLPIIDLITSITTRLFPNIISIGIIIKTIFLLIMMHYLIFKSVSRKRKLCLKYILIITIYIIAYILSKISLLNMHTFIIECTNLLKLLYYPILLSCLYCYFDDKRLSKKELNNILITNLLTYSILLLIPFITKTGFLTYNNGLSGTIGWYYSANEISIILVLLFPFIYSIIKNKNILYVLIPIVIIFVISTIGTKASMIGLLIDVIILMILSCFYKKNKKLNTKLIIFSLILLLATSITFINSNSLTNLKTTFGIQEIQNTKQLEMIKQEQKNRQEERKQLKKELEELQKTNNNTKFEEFINKYGKALLSDRDLYVKVTFKIYKNNFNIKTLLFGIGYTNNDKINTRSIEKLTEIDPLDIFFHSGLIALIIMLLPFVYYLYKLITKSKLNINLVFYTLMLSMLFCISFISGHTLMAPAVSIYIVLYFILAFYELDLINKKANNYIKNKISIYALHLNYGGIEKNICTKANMLSEIYNVEIISLYKLTDKPVFNLNDNIKVKYLTKNIKPNKEKFIISLKNKNIINIIKEGLYAIKVLYLKQTLLTKSLINCNSEIIISTRLDFTKKLIKNNEYNNVKIAEEHIYHNNNPKYLKDLNDILKKVDYLMPSSNYLTNYYKELYPEYSHKIITNEMPIETDNSISNLKNKTIISVGRLSKEKGYQDLINLFSKIEDKTWTLNIIGNGPEYDNLNQQIKNLNLENNIKLFGTKTTKELNKLYKEASIYIMTSYEESFGLVLLEAASHGLPIIAYSEALGAKEILSNNNGILIDNRNEVEMINNLNLLMKDITLRKEYQKRALNISKKYNYELIKNNNIEFYQNIKKKDIYSNLSITPKKETLELISNNLKNNIKTFIITANPETYMLSEKDKEMHNILNNKDNLVVPDGIAIVKTANYLGYDIRERITGVEIAEHLLKLANKNKYKVYLFGATEEVIELLENKIKKDYPNIKLVGSSNGYIKDKDSVMEYIKTTNPDIIMLAMGIPLQEKLINKHIKYFKKGIFIGVGGSFDVLSGSKKRAPKIFIKLNLEWLYRIVSEPKRLKRFYNSNIKFIFKILKIKLFHK